MERICHESPTVLAKEKHRRVRLVQRNKTINREKIMFGAVIVFAVVVAIVATYIFIVNRLLRSDENWSESNMVKPAVKAST